MSIIEVPDEFDHEADVIVVGGGTAGLPAAIVVAESGLKATVLESMSTCGGSFNMIAGDFAIAGSEEQIGQGIDDSPEIFCADMIDVCGADPQLARAYVDNQIHGYRMLKEGGIVFPAVNILPGHSRPRGLSVRGLGPKMVKAMEKMARNRGVKILFGHRAKRLIMDGQSGDVLGLRASTDDKIKSFRARRAVILATGGFGRNREMIAEYAPEMVDAIPKMPAGHLGDGLRMGLDAGAATADIGCAVAPSWPVCIETHSNALLGLWFGGIMVNVDGNRFHDESSAESFYGPMTGAGMRQPGGVYWVVFNGKIKEQVKDLERCKLYKAETIDELAKIAGLDAAGLTRTIDTYNNDIDHTGYDKVFKRKFQFGSQRALVRLDVPPFYAIKCVTSITSIKGGLRINARAQVLNNFNEIVPGLYAAGEVTGGLHTKSYLLGAMSSAAFTFGIIAAGNAINEPPRQ